MSETFGYACAHPELGERIAVYSFFQHGICEGWTQRSSIHDLTDTTLAEPVLLGDLPVALPVAP